MVTPLCHRCCSSTRVTSRKSYFYFGSVVQFSTSLDENTFVSRMINKGLREICDFGASQDAHLIELGTEAWLEYYSPASWRCSLPWYPPAGSAASVGRPLWPLTAAFWRPPLRR